MQVPPLNGFPFQRQVIPMVQPRLAYPMHPTTVLHPIPQPPRAFVAAQPAHQVATPVKFAAVHPLQTTCGFQESSICQVPIPVEREVGNDQVSLDYANQKLWSVTSEYENLLTVQKEQHDLQLRQKDMEIQSLYAELGGNIDSRNDSYEKAMAVSLEAKNKELELYASLLQLRDKQIGELQCHIEQKDANASCNQSIAPCPNCDGQASNRDVEINLMRREKDELERLVLSKDKEIQAMSNLDPDMCCDGALQLGAKAVQLYYDSIDFRKLSEQQKVDLAAEQRENMRLAELVHEVECQLKEKREEISDAVQQIAAKTSRIADLENAVVTTGQDLDEARKELQHLAHKDAGNLQQVIVENDALTQVIAELKAELARRDKLLIDRRAEEVAVESEAKLMGGKLLEQKQHLESAEIALDKMLAHNNYKDQLVREMTEQINISETKLHSYQVHELLRNRQRELEQKVRESELQENMHEKDRILHSLDAELRTSQERMNRIRNNLDDSNCECDVPPQNHADTYSGNPPGNLLAAPAPSRAQYSQQAYKNSEQLHASHLYSDQGSPQPPAPRQVFDDRGGDSQVHSGRNRDGSQADDSHFYQSIFGQAYQPYPNDPIDGWIASFVNDTGHRHLKALFCRLNKGTYLYGTQRVNFQLARDGNMVEAYDGNRGWIPLPEFIKSMEPQASAHLFTER
eukprot:GEMP01006995.1.p1 GENE.GEMP01006995.1~~GEMP01006995.1.p1  ORF type:complete len:688 (+),score=147.25 GEMP01006995.1:90-2153(+)